VRFAFAGRRSRLYSSRIAYKSTRCFLNHYKREDGNLLGRLAVDRFTAGVSHVFSTFHGGNFTLPSPPKAPESAQASGRSLVFAARVRAKRASIAAIISFSDASAVLGANETTGSISLQEKVRKSLVLTTSRARPKIRGWS